MAYFLPLLVYWILSLKLSWAALPEQPANTEAKQNEIIGVDEIVAANQPKLDRFLEAVKAAKIRKQNSSSPKVSSFKGAKMAKERDKMSKTRSFKEQKKAKKVTNEKGTKIHDAAQGLVLVNRHQVIPYAVKYSDFNSNSYSDEEKHHKQSDNHFSLSENEYYQDCTSVSGSSSDSNFRPYGYRLRHKRIRAEQTKNRKCHQKDSLEDASESESWRGRRKTRRIKVLIICEDELARRDNREHHRKRSMKRCGNNHSSDSFLRIDYRKKVCYRSFSESYSSSAYSSSSSCTTDL